MANKARYFVALLIIIALAFNGLNSLKLHPEVESCNPSHPEMFKFLGSNVVNLVEGQTATFETWCFINNKAWMEWVSETEIQVHIESSNKRSLLCRDNILITSLIDSHIVSKLISGTAKHTIKLKHQEDQIYVKGNGITIVPLCDKLKNIVPDVIDTIAMFDDKLLTFLPKWAIREIKLRNYQRLEKLTGAKWVDRKVKGASPLDWILQTVQSGDVYCQYGGDSVGTVILFGTGGVCNHVGMFLWEGSTLYFVESSGPGVHKIEAHAYYPSLQDPENNISVLQLSDEMRAKFDVNKAWASYNKLEGTLYGFENILFSFWDTAEQSFTQLANTDILMVYVAMMYKIPKARPLVAKIIEEGLNHRLGTSGLNFYQILEELGVRRIDIGNIGTIAENPSWKYGPDQGSRFICSALVTRLLIDAGVLAGYNIYPHEFTPNDVYNLKIWKTAALPAACQHNDPSLPYCQISGVRSLLPFKYFNSISIYDHMNERCPSVAPLYERPANC